MLEYLFWGTIVLLPLQFALNIGENVDLVTTRVLVPVVFLLWLLRSLAERRVWIPSRAETWLLLSFLLLSVISLWGGSASPAGLGGSDWARGIRKSLYLFSVVPIYFVAASLSQDRKFRMKTVWSIWASGLVAAVTGLAQFFMSFAIGLNPTLKAWKSMAGFFLGSSFGKLVAENPSWLVNVSGETWMRAFGFFPDPHAFSFFVSLCFFAGAGLFFSTKNNFGKISLGTGNFLMFLAIILSFSRGAYLGLITGMLFFLVFFLKRENILKKAAIVGAAVLIMIFILYQQVIFQRLASTLDLKEGSNIERIRNWQQAADIIGNYPLFGIGLGNYASFVDPMSGERSSIYAHNVFLDIASETGIANSVIFLLVLLAGIWRGISSKNMIGLGIASGLVYFLVHGIFDTPVWSPQVMVILLVMLALGKYPSNLKSKIENGKTAT